jgi:hypothetical protein
MAYEGLDCKQATHVIVLTDIRSLLWLIQMLTRVMRADTHEEALLYEDQYAMCFCPDDDDMIDAIGKLRGDPDGSVDKKEDDLDLLLSQLNLDEANKSDPPAKPVFSDCSSAMGGMAQINPHGEKLPSDTRIKVEQFKLKQGIHAPESEIYKMLQITGMLHLLNDVAKVPSIPSENIGMTVREQEDQLRKKIQDKASWLDHKFGYGFG